MDSTLPLYSQQTATVQPAHDTVSYTAAVQQTAWLQYTAATEVDVHRWSLTKLLRARERLDSDRRAKQQQVLTPFTSNTNRTQDEEILRVSNSLYVLQPR